jgi:hypothetical protein
MPKYFNSSEEILAHHGHLPHWRQEGKLYFITSRLADSMPKEKLREWRDERLRWLENHGLRDSDELDSLPEAERHEFHSTFTARRFQSRHRLPQPARADLRPPSHSGRSDPHRPHRPALPQPHPRKPLAEVLVTIRWNSVLGLGQTTVRQNGAHPLLLNHVTQTRPIHHASRSFISDPRS